MKFGRVALQVGELGLPGLCPETISAHMHITTNDTSLQKRTHTSQAQSGESSLSVRVESPHLPTSGYTITSVGFGDITPRNVLERTFCSAARTQKVTVSVAPGFFRVELVRLKHAFGAMWMAERMRSDANRTYQGLTPLFLGPKKRGDLEVRPPRGNQHGSTWWRRPLLYNCSLLDMIGFDHGLLVGK